MDTNLTPVFTLILALLIRGETITIYQITGLIVIIAGITITRKGSSAGRANVTTVATGKAARTDRLQQ